MTLRELRVEQVPVDEWLREVIAGRDGTGCWHVFVGMANVVHEDPWAGELEAALTAAITAVPGVEGLGREDHEVWAVWGTPSGEQLVHAVASLVDQRVPDVRRRQREAVLADRAGAAHAGLISRKLKLITVAMVLAGLVTLVAGIGNGDLVGVVIGVLGLALFGGGYLAARLLTQGARREGRRTRTVVGRPTR